MFHRRLITTILYTALLSFGHTQFAHACRFHGGGFDGSSFSRFGPLSSYHPGSIPPAEIAYRKSNINISLPSMIRAKINEEKSLTVSYTLPTESDSPKIQLLLDTAPGILVENSVVILKGESGQHTFTLQPHATGAYRLKVTATNLNNGNIAPLRETVYVNIYD